jgi:hypothetical protein
MGLSDDQRAMLRLLAQRGEQGYEDIAALKGVSVDEVRAQVAGALTQLDEEGALAPSSKGESAPKAPAEAPQAAPEASPPAEKAPTPPPPPPAPEPEAPTPAFTSPPSPQRAAGRIPKISMPTGSGLRAAIAGGIAVVALIAIVLIVSGGSDGESTASSAATAGSSAGAGEEAASNAATNSKEVTKAVLEPVDGSNAKGVAIFGKVEEGKKEKLALEAAIEGLEATGKGSAYTIWLSQSPQRMLPLASTAVDKTGKISGQYEVPIEVLAYLANETFKDLVVTKTSNAALEAALAKATQEKKSPAYTGTEVLRGTVTGPVVGAANK